MGCVFLFLCVSVWINPMNMYLSYWRIKYTQEIDTVKESYERSNPWSLKKERVRIEWTREPVEWVDR